MVEKIIVNPAEVRGLGNIVSPKTDADFVCHDAELTEATEVVGNVETTVYAMDYVAETLSLSSSAHSIYADESVVLTAVYNDPDVVTGETVTFLNGETSVGTAVFDSENTATLTLSGLSVGGYSFKASFESFNSNTVQVTVNKIVSIISLVTDKGAVFSGDTYTLSGVLSVGSGVSVKLYNGQTLVDTLTTGTGGAFTKTITATGTGITNTYRAVFEETSVYEGATSSNVTVNVVSSTVMELSVTGSSFSTYSSTPFTYTGAVLVDWGDNTGLVEYTGGQLSHTYSSSDDYDIKIYGNITQIGMSAFYGRTELISITLPSSVTHLQSYCFRACTGLTSVTLPEGVTNLMTNCFRECTGLTTITIPDTVTSIADYSFQDCTGLTEVVLEWDTQSEITTYTSNWINGCTSFDHFLIPDGTTSLYTAKSYPSNLLQEESGPTPVPDSIDLTGTKSILSYADSESCVLTATVLDSSDNPVEGVTVNLYNGSTLWDTLTTDSSGECSKTYSSAGSGDIVFTAEVDGTLLTKTYAVEDCFRYDDASSDKSSNYSTVNLNSLIFSSDHYEAYRSIGASPTSSFYSPIYVDETLPTDFEMQVTLQSNSANMEQDMLTIAPNHPLTYSGTNEIGLLATNLRYGLFSRTNGSGTFYTESGHLEKDTWYTYYLKVQGTSVTGKIYNASGTEIYTNTQTLSSAQSYKKWNIVVGAGSQTVKWKNLKIKPL